VVYKLPKEKLVYGPMQIEARVDQQTEISREMSLWGQRGSRVIRGNLLAIPLSDSFIYVEPVYLEARQEDTEAPAAGPGQRRGLGRNQQRPAGPGGPQQDQARAAALPELKRVIVAFGNRLVMRENLERALTSVLGERMLPEDMVAPAPAVPRPMGEISNLGALALEHYTRAQELLRDGKWAEYGRELEKLEKVLEEMAGKDSSL
jgi:hypothetical protein